MKVVDGTHSGLNGEPTTHELVEVLAAEVARDRHGPGDIDRRVTVELVRVEFARNGIEVRQEIALGVRYRHGLAFLLERVLECNRPNCKRKPFAQAMETRANGYRAG